MKTKAVKFLLVITVALLAITMARAQTNPPPSLLGPTGIVTNILANLPTTALANETVGISQGTLMRNDSTFASATLVDWTFKTNFFARAEIDEGTGAQSGIQGLAIGGGYCHTTSAARIYGVAEIRKDFAPSQWDGIAGAGIAYAPSTNGVIANFSTGAEQRAVMPINGAHSSPSSETIAYIRYSF